MLKVILSIAVLFLTTPVFADVTAEVISKKIDANGNIEIHTQYKIDGVEVQSSYPQDNGKYYWVIRYDARNFYGMSEAQAAERISQDIMDFAKTLILKPAVEDILQELKNKNTEIINTGVLQNIIGHSVVVAEAEIDVDTDFDGILDTTWNVKTDGTKAIEHIMPIDEGVIQ